MICLYSGFRGLACPIYREAAVRACERAHTPAAVPMHRGLSALCSSLFALTRALHTNTNTALLHLSPPEPTRVWPGGPA